MVLYQCFHEAQSILSFPPNDTPYRFERRRKEPALPGPKSSAPIERSFHTDTLSSPQSCAFLCSWLAAERQIYIPSMVGDPGRSNRPQIRTCRSITVCYLFLPKDCRNTLKLTHVYRFMPICGQLWNFSLQSAQRGRGGGFSRSPDDG